MQPHRQRRVVGVGGVMVWAAACVVLVVLVVREISRSRW
jgi:hypothetical protein